MRVFTQAPHVTDGPQGWDLLLGGTSLSAVRKRGPAGRPDDRPQVMRHRLGWQSSI